MAWFSRQREWPCRPLCNESGRLPKSKSRILVPRPLSRVASSYTTMRSEFILSKTSQGRRRSSPVVVLEGVLGRDPDALLARRVVLGGSSFETLNRETTECRLPLVIHFLGIVQTKAKAILAREPTKP